MASNLSAVLVILHCSFFSSVVVAFCFNAKALFTDYGVSSEDFGKAALISIPLSILTMLGLAWYSTKAGRFKLSLVMVNLAGLITLGTMLCLL